MFVESVSDGGTGTMFPRREEPAVLAVTIFVTRWQTDTRMAKC